MDFTNFETLIYEIMDRCKILFFPEQWQNILLNCSKNEAFTLFFLYRNAPVSMGEIAEYLGVPLNTVTGIISRLEKNTWLYRTRDPKDKRVVTVVLTQEGKDLLAKQLKDLTGYFNQFMADITPQELSVLTGLVDRFLTAVEKGTKPPTEEATPPKAIKKIEIL